jgi:two-component system, NarL family, nitrate/nitrite response regulator NarL
MSATLSSASAPPGAQRIRILIAYRNHLDSQLLSESLERNPCFQVVALPTSVQLLSAAATSKPDVALISVDLDSSPKKGLHLARRLNAAQPRVHIAILLDVPTRESVIAAFRAGARAVFCRTADISELANCIERTSRGEIFASNTEAEYLLEALRSGPSCDSIDSDTLSKLSKREIEVAEAAAQGHTNRQIADQLGLSEHTVKNYLSRAYEKLGVSTRMELLVLLSNKKGPTSERAAALDHVQADLH